MANSHAPQNNKIVSIQDAGQKLPSWITVNDPDALYRRVIDRGASAEVHEVSPIAQGS